MSKFIISSNLKNHIGKDLITDDIVAIFELVKNSYDAEATHVTIEFSDNQIVITDDGYGMSYDDIEKKRLFVGYSSKTDKDEQGEAKELKNRTKNLQRSYAGAKGVGRFACDRLGSQLTLYSKKKSGVESKLFVPRDKFEEDMNNEFGSIDVKLNKSNEEKIINEGTVLIVSNLRDKRDRQKKIKLKKQLMRLISPLEEKSNDIFEIEIQSQNEIEFDKLEKLSRNKVNGVIENDTLETIKKYTVYIDFTYSNGKITLQLFDRGRHVFGYTKSALEYTELEYIHGIIYYLNKTAKTEFHKLMGERNVDYGSIFLFKNNIRVYPFGEEGKDALGLDKRQSQGFARRFGTRDVLGYIDVKDSKNALIEKTSRDGGFLENEAYRQLLDFIKDEGVIKLEKYVVEALDWTENRKENEIYQVEDKIDNFKTFIQKQLKEKDITIEIGEEFDDILKEKDIISALEEKTKGTDLNKEVKKIVHIIKQTNQQKEEISKENEQNKKSLQDQVNKLNVLERQNEFLQDTQNISKEKIIGNIHDVGIIVDNLDVLLGDLFQNTQDNKELFEHIFLNIQKIKTIVAFATNSEYSTNTGTIIKSNLVGFIHERAHELSQNGGIKLQYNDNCNDIVFENEFSPMDINTIFLNLVSNSKRARAKKINIYFETKNNKLNVYYNDDGRGIDENIREKIFDLGVTTTNGSGVGLFVIQQIIQSMKGSISIADESNSKTGGLGGASFLLNIV